MSLFYSGKTWVFDQSERAQGLIYIIKADKPLGMLVEHSKKFVDHSPAALDLRILLMFYQHPAWVISLYNHRNWFIA